MKRLLILTGLLLLSVLTVSHAQAEPVAQGQLGDDTFTLIENAHQRREISLEQKTFYRLYALFRDQRLPARFRSQKQPKEDGTLLMARTLSVLSQLSEETRRAVAAYSAPITPSAPKSSTPTPTPPPNLSGLSVKLKELILIFRESFVT